ncbi:MAG TPA: efflux RND transporter periplasmic adaptor subunit [Bryobacteraceae bacterium]|nr:efflux RND transporter periplasmic adaptor subunit [Bryobacteraceae bacterium]
MKARIKKFLLPASIAALAAGLTGLAASCGGNQNAKANTGPVVAEGVSVGVTKIGRTTLSRTLTESAELIPFQEIDVYAKVAGYVKKLNVDYGSRVKTGDVLAILEVPELQEQLAQDDAAIKDAQDMIVHAQHELERRQASAKVLHLEFTRLDGVAKSKPGLVAQQEVDDAEGRDLSSQAQVEETKSTLQSAQSALEQAQDKRAHDQVLFDYTKITAPFEGVVTQRYANFGTLVQAGTGSSTQVLPLVRLSEDDKFRLAIPVPESYVHFIRLGDTVDVNVPSLNKKFPGRVARFAVDVREDTRTMHTEVDVLNPTHELYPGLYADATIMLERKPNTLAVPLQAVDRSGDNVTVDVITPANKVEIRRVTLGVQTANQAEILSGLQEGDQVVVSDRSSLKDGQAVIPKVIELLQYQGTK